jgi:hypothetical protein
MTQSGIAAGSIEAQIKQIQARTAEMAQQGQELQQRLGSIVGSATSRNGLATVSTGSGGILRSVVPGAGAEAASPAEFAAAIMEAYALASRQAAEQAAEVARSITGRDSQIMKLMREALPPVPVAEERGARSFEDGDDDAPGFTR